MTDNQIAGAILSYVDDKYHHLNLLRKITDHKSYVNATSINDGFIKSTNVNNVHKKNTAGWKCKWRDGST